MSNSTTPESQFRVPVAGVWDDFGDDGKHMARMGSTREVEGRSDISNHDDPLFSQQSTFRLAATSS
jgi:hypothetical protein